MYPASGGSEIDGAMAIDVETVARFLDLTGPIDVAGPDGSIRIDSSNAEEYLLRGQYAEIDDDDVRDAVLEELTSRLIADVFGGSLPGPTVLARTLGPAMDESRLVVWSRHADDQPLLEKLGIDGGLPNVEIGRIRGCQQQRGGEQARRLLEALDRLRGGRRRAHRRDLRHGDGAAHQLGAGRSSRRCRGQPVRPAARHEPDVPVGLLTVGADIGGARRHAHRHGAVDRAGLARLLPLTSRSRRAARSSSSSGSPGCFRSVSRTSSHCARSHSPFPTSCGWTFARAMGTSCTRRIGCESASTASTDPARTKLDLRCN